MQLCFFLTSPLTELISNWPFGCAITTDLQNKCLNEVFDPAAQRTLANLQPVPELRHRGGEFKRNMTTRRLRRNGYDYALLRLIVSLVRYHYSLAGSDTTRHQDQSAGSIDGDCKGLLVKRIATWQRAVNEQRKMDINPTRCAAIRVLGSGCFSHFGVLALERNNSTQFTPGVQSRSTGRGNSSEKLDGTEDFGQRQPKSDWYSRARDTWAAQNTSCIWPFDQLKARGRCEIIPAVLQNSRDD